MGSAIIDPICDRTDMAEVAQAMFYKTGNAAEVGAWRGEFSEHNLQFWKGKYFMIDKWAHRNDGSIDKNMIDAGSWGEVMCEAVGRTLPFGDRVYQVPEYSTKAAMQFKDGYFDWVYIDALHDYDSVMDDLTAWWSKLRPGGLFSGDDYGDTSDRWAARFGPYGQTYGWGVVQAVNEFARGMKTQVHITWMNDKTECPAWYIVKP